MLDNLQCFEFQVLKLTLCWDLGRGVLYLIMPGFEPVFLWLAFRMDGREVTELDSGVRSTGNDAFSLDAQPGDAAAAAVTGVDADVAFPATP